MARAARSSGLVSRRAPLCARPTGVRIAVTSTASEFKVAPPGAAGNGRGGCGSAPGAQHYRAILQVRDQIGRASCRERVKIAEGAVSLEKKKKAMEQRDKVNDAEPYQ